MPGRRRTFAGLWERGLAASRGAYTCDRCGTATLPAFPPPNSATELLLLDRSRGPDGHGAGAGRGGGHRLGFAALALHQQALASRAGGASLSTLVRSSRTDRPP